MQEPTRRLARLCSRQRRALQMTLETGEMGRQANGCVNLTYGETVSTYSSLKILIYASTVKIIRTMMPAAYTLQPCVGLCVLHSPCHAVRPSSKLESINGLAVFAMTCNGCFELDGLAIVNTGCDGCCACIGVVHNSLL